MLIIGKQVAENLIQRSTKWQTPSHGTLPNVAFTRPLGDSLSYHHYTELSANSLLAHSSLAQPSLA
jgi:hypothetical protein